MLPKNKSLYSVLLTLLLSACQSTNLESPDWYNSATNQDDKYLYGLGQGRSLQAAKNSALSQINAQLWTQIKSSYASRDVVQSHNENVNESAFVDNRINSQTAQLTFVDIEYPKVENNDISYFVEAKISRKKLIEQLTRDIHQANQNAQATLQKLNYQDKLIWWLNSRDDKEQLPSAQIRQAMLNSLGQKQIPKIDHIEQLDNTIDKVHSQIAVHLSASQKDANNAQLLANAFSENKIKASTTSATSTTHILKMKSDIRRSKVGEAYMSTQFTQLKLLDNKGNTLASNEIISTGSSFTSYAISKEGSERNFIDIVEQQGIWRSLGL